MTEISELTDLIRRVEDRVRSHFDGEGTGHDWHHIDRVRNVALTLAKQEGADLEIVELVALLHDIADHKFHNNDLSEGPRQARAIVLEFGGSESIAEKVAKLVGEISFKGAGVPTPVSCVEAACVQDADRMDAIGAIGVARAFAYGGSKNRPIYTPGTKPTMHTDFKSYATDEGHTINHFYEKLLLLKDRMNTESGRKMAEDRHRFMEGFLAQFYAEWSGDK